MASYTKVALDDFEKVFGSTSTELSSAALGGKVLSVSDEWFAPASDLLKVAPAVSMKGQFGPEGAKFDGWETRRHNPKYDWTIIKLGPPAGGSLIGFDIDTAWFSGNEAPAAAVYGLLSDAKDGEGAGIKHDDPRWIELIPEVELGPSSRHLYQIPATKPITHVKLHNIPDGGIARFRVYGTIPAPPLGRALGEKETLEGKPEANTLDLAHVMNGGRAVFCSDQHYGKASNIVLPGRGKDMGDGWETKRSRTPGHRDWAVVRLGEPGYLSYAEIDTLHFLGNFPAACEIHATEFEGEIPPGTEDAEPSATWSPILERTKLGAGRQHFFKLTNVEGKRYSHVRFTMHPDGGIKRLRIVGRRAAPLASFKGTLPPVEVPFFDKALPSAPEALAAVQKAANSAMDSLVGSVSALRTNGSAVVASGGAAVTSAAVTAAATPSSSATAGGAAAEASPSLDSKGAPELKAVPITPAGFSAYGSVVHYPGARRQAGKGNNGVNGLAKAISGAVNGRAKEEGEEAVEAEAEAEIVNQGSARKFNKQGVLESTFPAEAEAQINQHLYRCDQEPFPLPIAILERHPHSSQSFVPMAEDDGAGLKRYIVVVALNGSDDKPDLSTLRAFVADTSCGIVYGRGVWHLPMKSIGCVNNFAVTVVESERKPELNCDEHWYKELPAAVVTL